MDITTLFSALSYWCIAWLGTEAILAVWTTFAPINPVRSFINQWRPTVMVETRQDQLTAFQDTLIYRRPE